VGYGDVGATNTSERSFRAVQMIISVILFSYFTSTIMEMTLNDTINQNKNQQNIDKINWLIEKYNFSGTTKN